MTKYAEPQLPAIFRENYLNLREFDRDLITVLSALSQNLASILDRGISFDDNVDCRFVTFTSHVTPGTEISVPHTLGKIPTGYIPVTKDKEADVYNTTSPDRVNLYLKCSASSATIKLLIF